MTDDANPPGQGAGLSCSLPTTTAVAYVWHGDLYLEQMNLLSPQGAGILAAVMPAFHANLELAFRLSTSPVLLRCQAEVISSVPLTPEALQVQHHGKAGEVESLLEVASVGSATSIVHISDIQKQTPPARGRLGFGVRFCALTPAQRELILKHLEFSRNLGAHMEASPRLAERAASGGKEPSLSAAQTAAALLNAGDIRQKTRNW